MKDALRRIGTWGGWASAVIVLSLSLVGRMESCTGRQISAAERVKEAEAQIRTLGDQDQQFQARLSEHIVYAAGKVADLDQVRLTIASQQAVLQEIIRRLDRIETKLDSRPGKSGAGG